ncbi:hypothetical protein NT239_11210 [Chitinibacter sp. SCUT-21]|uniref:hypothetical protein n=1 Tax=Chitinibacter sp. SCUT-21 TaxID=2970891 RepID=UPI0035A712B9
MFALLRILVLVAIVIIVYAGFRYVREREPRWLRLIRTVLLFVLSIGVIFGVGLFIERLTLG